MWTKQSQKHCPYQHLQRTSLSMLYLMSCWRYPFQTGTYIKTQPRAAQKTILLKPWCVRSTRLGKHWGFIHWSNIDCPQPKKLHFTSLCVCFFKSVFPWALRCCSPREPGDGRLGKPMRQKKSSPPPPPLKWFGMVTQKSQLFGSVDYWQSNFSHEFDDAEGRGPPWKLFMVSQKILFYLFRQELKMPPFQKSVIVLFLLWPLFSWMRSSFH